MPDKKGFRYQSIYENLKNAIALKTIPAGNLLPPENQIAMDNGVDRSTVRRALKMLVEEGLVEKLPGKGTVVIKQKNNHDAEQKASGQSMARNIGFLLPSGNAITQPFYSTLFCVLERELKRYNCNLIYSTFDAQNDLMETVARCNLNGIIFVSNTTQNQIGAAIQNGIPCTLVNNFDPRIPSILSDNFNGAYQAGKHLLQCGHKNVIVVSGVRSYTCSIERTNGFKQAFSEAGITIPDSSILEADSWEKESGMNVIKQYLKTCNVLPTAIFGLNDRLAFGVMQALHQCGMDVPKDISVIGYDNLNAQLSVVPLTTIEAHVEYLAEATAQAQIWQQLGGRRFPFRVNIPTELVIGETVRKI